MRLKKIMSLVLACAMALSLVTVASAQDTRVYHVEDFDSYTETSEFSSKMIGSYNVIAKSHGLLGQSGNLFTPLSEANATATGATYAKTWWNNSNDGAYIANGKFYPTAESAPTNVQTEFIIAPKSQWDFETSGETYVFSFSYAGTPDEDVTADTDGVMTNWSIGTAAHFVNDDKTASTTAMGTTVVVPQTSLDANQHLLNAQGKHNTSVVSYNATNGEEIQVALSYSNDSGLKRTWAINGTNLHSYTDATVTNTNLYAFSISGYHKILAYYDNIRMYTIKSDDFKVTAEQTTDVPLNTKSMRIKFSNLVAPATYAAPVVKADGVAMAEGTYSVGALKNYIGDVGGEIYSYVDVTFSGLEEGTTYTVEFPETIANEIATTLGTKNVATFSTKLPDVKIMPLTVVGAENLVANGELQAVKATLINNTAASKNVALIYAVYAGDKLADIVYVNDVVDVDGAEYEVGLKLTSAGTVKAFAWDGMTSLKPYTGSVQLTVAAAQ